VAEVSGKRARAAVTAPAAAPASARGASPWPRIAVLLLVACTLTALAVIYSAHRARELFRELEQARREHNEIQVEWRQLLLERSTLSSHARVESMAGNELRMRPPADELNMVVVE